MTEAAPDILALTRDARLAPYAMSAIPAWLWCADRAHGVHGARALWANATGAAALGAANVVALTERIFTTEEPLGADLARLAATLPPTAQKNERLRAVGPALVCAGARVEMGGVAGIRVTASEAGRTLPLAERAARLFGAVQQPLAVFTPDGALLYTNAELEAGTTVGSFGVETEKLGSGGNTVLLALLPHEDDASPEQQSTAPEDAPEETVPVSPSPGSERPLRFVWTMDADEQFHRSEERRVGKE